MTKRKIVNTIGIIGLIAFSLLVLINQFSTDESIFHPYKWKILITGLIFWFVHYCLMGVDAVKREKYIWAVTIFIAPIPMYWAYFAYYAFFLNDSEPTNI